MIASQWDVAVGGWAMKRGYRILVDNGPARHCKNHVFQLRMAGKERMASFTQAIPVWLYVYLEPCHYISVVGYVVRPFEGLAPFSESR